MLNISHIHQKELAFFNQGINKKYPNHGVTEVEGDIETQTKDIT
jgi:hypothetical protein